MRSVNYIEKDNRNMLLRELQESITETKEIYGRLIRGLNKHNYEDPEILSNKNLAKIYNLVTRYKENMINIYNKECGWMLTEDKYQHVLTCVMYLEPWLYKEIRVRNNKKLLGRISKPIN